MGRDIATNLLDAVFEQLNPLQQALLCAFSIYRLPIPIEAAQALLEPQYQKQARPALRTLLNQHLIQSAQDATYQLHVIIGRYAQQHWGEGDEQANQQALQEAHSNAALYYRELSALNYPQPEQPHSVKEMEPLLEAIWHLAQAKQWQEAYKLTRDEDVFEMLYRCGGFPHLVEVSQLFLTSSFGQEQPADVASLSSYQGKGYRMLGRPHQALICFEQALAIAQEIGNRAEEGVALNNLGLIYDDLGKQTEALEYYHQALVIAQEVGNRAGEEITLWNIGDFFLEQEQYATALAALLIAGRLFQQVLSPEQEAVERSITKLKLCVGEEQFRELSLQVSLQPEHILKQALSEWKEQNKN